MALKDLERADQGLVVTISGVVEWVSDTRHTQNGKPWVSFTVSDGTGKCSVSWFEPIPDVQDRLKAQTVNVVGKVREPYKGTPQVTAQRVDFGVPAPVVESGPPPSGDKQTLEQRAALAGRLHREFKDRLPDEVPDDTVARYVISTLISYDRGDLILDDRIPF